MGGELEEREREEFWSPCCVATGSLSELPLARPFFVFGLCLGFRCRLESMPLFPTMTLQKKL